MNGLQALQPFARVGELNEPFLKGLPAILVLRDYILGRAGEKILVAEFHRDFRDLDPSLVDLLVETRAFGGKIDNAQKRQGDDVAANHQLERAVRRRIGLVDLLHASEPLDAFAPGSRAPGP